MIWMHSGADWPGSCCQAKATRIPPSWWLHCFIPALSSTCHVFLWFIVFFLSSLNSTLVRLFARNVLEEAALRSGQAGGRAEGCWRTSSSRLSSPVRTTPSGCRHCDSVRQSEKKKKNFFRGNDRSHKSMNNDRLSQFKKRQKYQITVFFKRPCWTGKIDTWSKRQQRSERRKCECSERSESH